MKSNFEKTRKETTFGNQPADQRVFQYTLYFNGKHVLETLLFFYFEMKGSLEKAEKETMKVAIVVRPPGPPPKESGKAWYWKPNVIN